MPTKRFSLCLLYAAILAWTAVFPGTGITVARSDDTLPSASENTARADDSAVESSEHQAPGASQPTPAAHFPASSYEFPPVLEGTIIEHSFAVQNRGTADLQVIGVRTG